MRILQEGPFLEYFDPTNTTKLWTNHVVPRPAQSKSHCNYKKRQSKLKNNNNEFWSTDDNDDDEDDDETEL